MMVTSQVVEMPAGGGVLPYMGYIGMCHCEGYGFQAVYSVIAYINQRVWDYNMVSFFRKRIKNVTKSNHENEKMIVAVNAIYAIA